MKSRLYSIPEYVVWEKMRHRCCQPRNPSYSRYGGRGIKVCAQWEATFWKFLSDMGPRPTPKHTLERNDVNGDYTPENCRWATWKEQQNNRTNNCRLTCNGETHTLAEWEGITGISAKTLQSRLRQSKWPVEKILFSPKYGHRQYGVY